MADLSPVHTEKAASDYCLWKRRFCAAKNGDYSRQGGQGFWVLCF